MDEVYLMERTWDGPQPLLKPNWLPAAKGIRSRGPALPPIDTWIITQLHNAVPAREYPQAESPGSTQSTPYPSPSTALTTPSPLESPTTTNKIGRDGLLQRLVRAEAENRKLRDKVDDLETLVQQLWVSRDNLIADLAAEEAENRKLKDKVDDLEIRVQQLWVSRDNLIAALVAEVVRNRETEELLHERIHGLSMAQDLAAGVSLD